MEVFKERAVTYSWFRNCGVVTLTSNYILFSVITSNIQLFKINTSLVKSVLISRRIIILGDKITVRYSDEEKHKELSYITRQAGAWQKHFESSGLEVIIQN